MLEAERRAVWGVDILRASARPASSLHYLRGFTDGTNDVLFWRVIRETANNIHSFAKWNV